MNWLKSELMSRKMVKLAGKGIAAQSAKKSQHKLETRNQHIVQIRTKMV
jgi:hypothetical protein